MIEIEWKVTWFPYDVGYRSKMGTEAVVKAKAEEMSKFFPMVERREVEVTEWKIAE